MELFLFFFNLPKNILDKTMNIFKSIKNTFLRILGDIKVYLFPMFIVYDPSTYRIKGTHTREAINTLLPGDIILRKYVNYLDGFFIPGTYSHSSIYIGGNKIIHAIAEGIEEIDVIDFLRCDGFCILRQESPCLAAKAVETAKSLLGKQYDFDFKDGNNSYYCHELTANCYPDLGIKKSKTRILGFRVKDRYLADSFLECDKFQKILEINP